MGLLGTILNELQRNLHHLAEFSSNILRSPESLM